MRSSVNLVVNETIQFTKLMNTSMLFFFLYFCRQLMFDIRRTTQIIIYNGSTRHPYRRFTFVFVPVKDIRKSSREEKQQNSNEHGWCGVTDKGSKTKKKPKEMRVGIHLALANGFISLYSPFTVFRE